MKSTKLGAYIEQIQLKNEGSRFHVDSVVGLSTQKEIIITKANLEGINLDTYKIFPPMSFAYVPDTSRRGDKIALAFNQTEKTFIVSSIYIVFQVTDVNVLNPWYLFMFFNRPEFDRFTRFSSWGSARETFAWEDMCGLEISLPNIEVQAKYANIYKAMVVNQQRYECGLDDIKLICDGYIENLRRKYTCQKIGPYLEICEEKNSESRFGISSVRGVSIEKKFIETKADMTDVDLSPYYLVRPNEFTYVTVTSRNGGKISIAMNDSDDTYICSSSYVVFRSKNTEILYPGYLMLFFLRPEFDRKARFCSWGSAREIFEWSELCELKIPIPEIGVQKAIAEVYSVYSFRKKINEQLKDQIKNICPILIKGSLEEEK